MADLIFDRKHFDALYRADADPWAFRTSDYEKQKYAATLAALPRATYPRVLELGCSIGELTWRLAGRAGHVTAVETSAIALETARHACREQTTVTFVQAHLPDGDWAHDTDLVVLSEILYFLDEAGVRLLARRIAACAPDADIVLVHWTEPTNYPMTGDTAVAAFLDELAPRSVRSDRTTHYRLDVVDRSIG